MTDRRQFRLDVVLMSDPCLWRWDIRDEAHGVTIHSSWDQDWMAYPSREDADHAGREELARVMEFDTVIPERRPGAEAPGRGIRTTTRVA